jgi:signal transduction histidine kinase
MSFRARLTLAYLALLTLALSAFGFGVYAYVDARVHREVEESFLNQARTFGQLVQGYYNITINNVRSILTAPGTYYVVSARHVPSGPEHPNLNLPSPALGANDLPVVPADRKVHTVPKWDNQLGTTLAVYTVDFEAIRPREGTRNNPPSGDDPLPRWKGRLVLARDLGSVESSLGLLRKILIAGGAAVLAVAALVGWVLAAGLLRPLARMKSTAQRIGDDRDFKRRMPVDNAKDELGRLSTSFNQMLTELEQSHLDLQTALESQRRFVADASHELRTPMTAIRTNVEFLARVPGARKEDRAAALHDVLTEMRRMEELVGDLLALARLEATGAGPVRRTIRLDHLLADIHRDASRVARPGVEVRLGPTPEVRVSGDRDDLRRAVWNLVENALKYTRAGRVDLRLRAAHGIAELEVRDTGIGIAEADQARVFDRFWRAQSTRGTSGSGLGLAITKWVAQAHGGTVLVESVLDHGTTFTLQLPATVERGRPRRPRTADTDELVRAGVPADPAHS